MAVRAFDVVRRFAPKSLKGYADAFEHGDALLDEYSLNTPKRIAHFMAQVMHETGGLSILVESGRYKETGLARMWDDGNWHKYFPDRASCLAMADRCKVDAGEALFNLVYGNRLGNGPPESGDGWAYRGRGVLQTTGRWAYRSYGRRWGVDFEGQPELIVAAEHALKPALTEWNDGHLNVAADANDIEVITRKINGKLTGLDKRKAWFAKIWPFVRDGKTVEDSIEYRVQKRLHALGYKYVNADGVVGKNTRTAIVDFSVKNRVSPTTKITPELLEALGIT